MTGIFLLLVLASWLAFVIWVSKLVTRKLPIAWWRTPFAVLVFAVLLPLPLIDEIVGGRQFAQLCKANEIINVDRVTALGKTVYFVPQSPVEVKGTWVRIVLQPQRFVDVATSQTVVSYNLLIAAGGWLRHKLPIGEGGMPLTFRGTCAPANQPASVSTFKEYGINYIEPPSTINGVLK